MNPVASILSIWVTAHSEMGGLLSKNVNDPELHP